MMFPQFDTGLFNEFIDRHGQNVRLELADACVCQTDDFSGSPPASGCPNCGGLGFTYTPAGEYRVLVQSADNKILYAVYADLFVGDLRVTLPTMVRDEGGDDGWTDFSYINRLDANDRITLLDVVETARKTMKRGAGHRDLIPELNVIEILDLRRNGAEYKGTLVADGGKWYVEWGTKRVPSPGDLYVCEARLNPGYRVFGDAPSPRQLSAQRLPRTVMVRRLVPEVHRTGVET